MGRASLQLLPFQLFLLYLLFINLFRQLDILQLQFPKYCENLSSEIGPQAIVELGIEVLSLIEVRVIIPVVPIVILSFLCLWFLIILAEFLLNLQSLIEDARVDLDHGLELCILHIVQLFETVPDDVETVLEWYSVRSRKQFNAVILLWNQLLELQIVFLEEIDGVDKLSEQLMGLVEDALQSQHVVAFHYVDDEVSLLGQVGHQAEGQGEVLVLSIEGLSRHIIEQVYQCVSSRPFLMAQRGRIGVLALLRLFELLRHFHHINLEFDSSSQALKLPSVEQGALEILPT